MADEYISRESVMQKFADHVKRSNNSDFAPTPTWNQAVQIVEDIPAADVAPVRHGRWTDKRTLEHDGEWYCSVCGKEITIYMGPERPDRYQYCPNCGAKMDGGNTDER